MPGLGATVERTARRAQKELRRRRLEHGESGWGAPVASPPVLPGHLARPCSVVLVGAGAQGGRLADAVSEIDGMEVAGIVDLDLDRAVALAERLGVDASVAGTDAAAVIGEVAPELAMVATTAPHHVELGRVALSAGARRILLEKPVDNSYADAAAFTAECAAAGVPLGISYLRRFVPDYRHLAEVVRSGAIGTVRVISAQPGPGELAMLASHYVDFARMLLGDEVVEVSARLRPLEQANRRGAEFDDPTGNLVLTFRGGARCFIDVGTDLPRWTGFLTIRGDLGTIVVEEAAGEWSVRAQSARTWTFPMAEPYTPLAVSKRVVHSMVTEDVAACTGEDGLAALEVVLAAHHSSRDGGRTVALPLTEEQRSLVVRFP